MKQDKNYLTARIILSLNIKRLREERKLSQEGLADLVGLHRTYIGSVERCERNISIDNIERIASVFDVPPSFLLGNSNK